MVNLDCDYTDSSDLWAFFNAHSGANKSSRLLLCGQLGRGTITATKNLCHYAANKATAMDCRKRGDIATAQSYEAICDRIYSQLPDYAKW